MWKLIDQFLDNISARLAENFTSNLDEVAENRMAREITEQPLHTETQSRMIKREGRVCYWSDDIISDDKQAPLFERQSPEKQTAEVALLA